MRLVGERETAALAAANSFTDWVPFYGYFNLILTGTWVGTLTLQVRFEDDEATVYDMQTWTANPSPTKQTVFEPEQGAQYRLGFKAGEYTSGTANVRLSQSCDDTERRV